MPTRLSAGRSLELPQVDDNPGDARLTREALRHDREIEHRLHLVKDGVEALAYPRGEGGFVDEPRPDLDLFDLDRPRKDGRAVLAVMEADPDLRCIPVIALTTSTVERAVLDCYRLKAAGAIARPVVLDNIVTVSEPIESVWLRVVTFPTA